MGSKKNKLGDFLSPLTKSNKLEIIETFDVAIIIELYKRQVNIDVSRYFNELEEISLIKCVETGYLFYAPFSVVGDDRFYEELSTTRTNYYSERWEHKKIIEFLTEKDKILEIGSGFGAFIKLLHENKIFDIKGLELNKLAVAECVSSGLNVEAKLIEEEALTKFEYYTVVCSFQVLEHITGVYEFIESSLKTLKKDGKLIIGVPNNNPYIFISDKWHTFNLPPHHAGLWNKNSLKSLEKIFPIKLANLEHEPLENTYDYFLNIQILNANYFKKTFLKGLNKITPNLLKFFYCSFVKGRNVLAVFVKY
ncbi:bifunctional 2-polyprenyl-6-hydroxyphenol methylase/3-demethylubiquinol 3-O-methyltransferase UbiG [Flavobacterium sp. A45]|uniref:class I SAM-dependent methyltransferase n=1 Tax=Flavobacterium sp. A45 TaxID=1945862 RepID=UPI000987225F|nr:methionine biosynthesis protein MetW [Flavobacterium sp. A45]OOG62331.1 hypothetical protein B0E44_18580 [Flavobacterium sp. A45]